MGSRTYDTEDDHTLRNDRVNNDRAEDLVVLTEILRHLGGLCDTALDVYRGYASLGLTDVEALLHESCLDRVSDLKTLLAEPVALLGHDYFQTLDVTDNQRHRKRLGIHLGAHVRAEILDYAVRTCHETSDGSH